MATEVVVQLKDSEDPLVYEATSWVFDQNGNLIVYKDSKRVATVQAGVWRYVEAVEVEED